MTHSSRLLDTLATRSPRATPSAASAPRKASTRSAYLGVKDGAIGAHSDMEMLRYRVLGLPIRLCLLVLANLVRLLQNLARLPRRRPAWVRISLKVPLPARPPRLGPFRRRSPSLAALTETTSELAADPRVEGVVIDLHALGGGWVQAQNLRALIADLRAKGKRVVCHLTSPNLRAYFVACAADQIFMDESGFLGLRGLAAEAMFLGGALGKAGVEPQLAYRGPYKSFAETLMKDDMSAAHREAL